MKVVRKQWPVGVKKVLFADDDADERALFQNVYQNRTDILLLPCSVNGSEVISRLNNTVTDSELPDLIILDQNMPLMNGKQTLTFRKSNKRFSNIPVCICSYADNKLVEDCMRLRAYKVTSKPITEEQYQEMMDEFKNVFDQEELRQ